MKIGSVILDNPTVLAPLAGITNLPFRLMAKKAGCGLVCSEMISANGLVYGSQRTREMLGSLPEEKPFSVQLFGSDSQIMAEAARIVESSGADIVDINFGCSVKKILKSGCGAALMKTPDKAEALLKNVRQAIRIPLTIKMRTGWDPSGRQALELTRIAEACGVDAVAVHPRTATQQFRGYADWSIIAEIKRQVSIPVIGNGDVCSAEDAAAMCRTTGCDAVMIGRKAIGQPWIFSQVISRLKGEDTPAENLIQRFDVMSEFVKASVRYFGEERACRMMRSRLGWFVKSISHGSQFRESIRHVSNQEEAEAHIRAFQSEVRQRLQAT
jgi:tRNA-dihydrouridine synthase B